MKLGCNLSNELIELIKSKGVNIDCIKIMLKELNEEIPNDYKSFGEILLHGVGNDIPQHTGAILQKKIDWKELNKKIEFCGCSHIGVHCATYWSDWSVSEITYDMVKDRMSNFIKEWKKNINTKLLIENVPYTPYYEKNKPGIIRHSVDSKLFNELCDENDIGLLLDVAHAKVAAHGLNMDLKLYLSQLPLNLVEEFHVVGTRSCDDGTLRDNHLEMDDFDYKIVEWLLERTSPKIVTLEYGGFGEHYSWRSDINAIQRQICMLQGIIRKFKQI